MSGKMLYAYLIIISFPSKVQALYGRSLNAHNLLPLPGKEASVVGYYTFSLSSRTMINFDSIIVNHVTEHITLLKTPFIPDKLYRQNFQVFMIFHMHIVEEAYYSSH